MKKGFYIIFVLIITCFVCQSCRSKKNVTKNKNFAYLYNPSSSSLHPEYLIYHKTELVSQLLVKFYPGEILFNQTNEGGEFTAGLKFSYKLFDYETKNFVDSSSSVIKLDLEEMQDEMITFVPFKALIGKKYIIQVIIQDIKRNSQHRASFIVDKTNKFNSQNYLIRKFGTSAPVFNGRVDSTESFFIEYAHSHYDSLNVCYYKNDFTLPNPPSTVVVTHDRFDYPDTQYVLSDTFLIRLNKKGLYTFQVDTGKFNGISILYFGESFPHIRYFDDLTDPLSYLMNDTEFRKFASIPNKKLAVDNFWLKAAQDNIDLSRELIRIFYNRAYLANYYFTSYKEGWKTDRGMIYIIYGLPNIIYKTDDSEKWIYEDMKGSSQLYFKFKKINHPFSENVYMLERSELLQTRWRDAIDSWKNGKPYVFN